MRKEEYQEKLIKIFLKKYYSRTDGSNRRPSVTPDKLYKSYYKNNRSNTEKGNLDSAIHEFYRKGIFDIEKDCYGKDIKKIFMKQESITILEKEAERFNISTRSKSMPALEKICSLYRNKHPNIDEYIEEIRTKTNTSPESINLEREEQKLKAASWLADNKEDLYEREASMLIFGASKVLEELKPYLINIFKTESLENFHIKKQESTIYIKGNALLKIKGNIIETKIFHQGLGISSEDLKEIEEITIREPEIMTIENKVSFLRTEPESKVCIFLSGFANTSQVAFLKKTADMNPNISFSHFGDIDIGGFLILDDLLEKTGINIKPYHMGIRELSMIQGSEYSNCLQPLTESDIERKDTVSDQFKEIITYMMENNIKLEQEILSYVEHNSKSQLMGQTI